MSAYLHNLDRDALLMLYLAGELPGEDHAEVDAMLANDPALRAAYEQMVSSQDSLVAVLSAADAKLPLPTPQLSSVRRVGAAMNQWHIDKQNRAISTPVRPAKKYGWLYAVAAAAAMITVTVFVLWSRVDDGKTPDGIAAMIDKMNKPDGDTKDDPKAAPVVEVATRDDADVFTPSIVGDADTQLSRAEVEIDTVDALSDSLRITQEAVTP